MSRPRSIDVEIACGATRFDGCALVVPVALEFSVRNALRVATRRTGRVAYEVDLTVDRKALARLAATIDCLFDTLREAAS